MKYRGETISKATKCRKIDLRIECRVQGMEVVELSHSEAAPSATPAKAVRDRSKCYRTNQCILNELLRQNISDEGAKDSIIFGFQFSGEFPSSISHLTTLIIIGIHYSSLLLALSGQLIGIDLVDDGLYFGVGGPSFCFPSQLLQLKSLQHALEVIYFFKVNEHFVIIEYSLEVIGS